MCLCLGVMWFFCSRVATAESLGRLLGQAVQSGDRSLLEEALRVRRENIIRQTLRRLPLSLILPLLKQVCGRPTSLLDLSCLHPAAGQTAGDFSLKRSGAESVGPPPADSALCLPYYPASANGHPVFILPGLILSLLSLISGSHLCFTLKYRNLLFFRCRNIFG